MAGTVLAIGACGSSTSSSGGGSGSSSASSGGGGANTVDVYSSLPLQGASTAQTDPMVNGIKLALAQAGNKAGTFTVRYQSLDDSTAQAGKWDPGQTAAVARKVATDPKAVYYIGDFNSGASEVSIPILNQAGVSQVSPANTYVGLTVSVAGASLPGEPQKYYPTGKRTYLRIVPRDTVQAAAGLQTMKADGCTKIAVANDKEAYGAGLAALLELEKAKYGLTITSNTGIDPTSPNFRSYAQTIKAQGADCFYFSGIVSNGAVQITKDVNAALPKAKIYAPDGACTGSYTNPAMHGLPASIDPKVQCTVATLNLAAYPGGKTFLAAYKAAYGSANPDPYAIYGYAAMKLGLDTIAKLGAKGSDKSAVLAALFATKTTNSVLGTFGFDANGDTTLKTYGLYKVGPDGNPLFEKTVTPS
ncbi:MAG: branched-chain amino acid ABC transporter substrate-binding protein [Solirubrobacteraceae bacterium]